MAEEKKTVVVKVGVGSALKASSDLYGTFERRIYIEHEGDIEDVFAKADDIAEQQEVWLGNSVKEWAKDPDLRKELETIKKGPQNPVESVSAPVSGQPVPTPDLHGDVLYGSEPPAPFRQGVSNETVQVQAFRVWNLPSGGKGVKMIGGPWTEYGVTCYPEVLQTIGFDPNMLEPADYPPAQPMRAVVQMKWKYEAGQQPKLIPDKVTGFIT